MLTLFIDGDAFPNRLKKMVFKAIVRKKITTEVYSNQPMNLGQHDLITYRVVPEGPDVADAEIAQRVTAGDLVITADIPLADQVLEKGAHALDHRGTMWTASNIKQALATRDLMQDLQDFGEINRRGPRAFGDKDAQNFANALDRFLNQYVP